MLGEIGVAFVVPAPGSDVSLSDLRSWAAGSLADYKSPDRLSVVESLPVTSMMKVDKRALAEPAAAVAGAEHHLQTTTTVRTP